MSKIDFEIEVVQEIWRTPDLTFTLMYPTHSIAAVKGLRGTFSTAHRKELERVLHDRGFKTVIYERKLEGDTFIDRFVDIQ